ncbi:MAG: hypothetical protein AAF462_03960 [Thermodesulfobacteriota bacterium]
MKFQKLNTILLLSSVLVVCAFLFSAANAAAQSVAPETRCYNKKLKASGAYVNCLLRAERNANRNMEEVSDQDVAHCHELFEDRYSRAEAQAQRQGAECPSHGGLVPYQDTVVGAAAEINSNNDVKTLNIEIEPGDFQFLQDRSFNLNIAVLVNDQYNVIWRSTSEYTEINQYQWSPVFQVFGASNFEQGLVTSGITNVVKILTGQDAVLGIDNLINTPVPGNNANGIKFMNNSSDPVFPALSQLITFLGSTKAITSIFVSEDPIPGGEELVMTPTQKVRVWFSQETQTGEQFIDQPITFVDIDFTNTDTATRRYSNGVWEIE